MLYKIHQHILSEGMHPPHPSSDKTNPISNRFYLLLIKYTLRYYIVTRLNFYEAAPIISETIISVNLSNKQIV